MYVKHVKVFEEATYDMTNLLLFVQSITICAFTVEKMMMITMNRNGGN
jgi:hypothetical protein